MTEIKKRKAGECDCENEHHLTAQRARSEMPTEEEIARMSGAFKAICEPSRLKILLALRQGELCVYHIVEAVGGTQSAVSHQLRVLRDNRVIRSRRDGQNIVYSLADEHISRLLEMACEHLGCGD